MHEFLVQSGFQFKQSSQLLIICLLVVQLATMEEDSVAIIHFVTRLWYNYIRISSLSFPFHSCILVKIPKRLSRFLPFWMLHFQCEIDSQGREDKKVEQINILRDGWPSGCEKRCL